jgi:hypothetical protein
MESLPHSAKFPPRVKIWQAPQDNACHEALSRLNANRDALQKIAEKYGLHALEVLPAEETESGALPIILHLDQASFNRLERDYKQRGDLLDEIRALLQQHDVMDHVAANSPEGEHDTPPSGTETPSTRFTLSIAAPAEHSYRAARIQRGSLELGSSCPRSNEFGGRGR